VSEHDRGEYRRPQLERPVPEAERGRWVLEQDAVLNAVQADHTEEVGRAEVRAQVG
jgi:hypothetical protein